MIPHVPWWIYTQAVERNICNCEKFVKTLAILF